MTAQTSRPLTAPTCPCRRSPPSSRSSSPNWTFRGSRWSATTPSLFGALSKQRIPEDLFGTWIGPLRRNPKVRRDLTKYLRTVPKPDQLLAWADQQRSFAGPVLIIWARDDKLMPPTHAQRLADHFPNTQLVWIDDSYTLIPIDQPETLTDHLNAFLAAQT